MATAVLSFPLAMIADAVGLGNAGPFAVLHLGCGSGSHGQLKVNTGTVAAGDVGIGAGATGATDPFGFGKFQKGSIDGALLVDVNATSSVVAKNFTVSGGTSAADLRPAVDDAIAASAAAAALPGVAVGDVTGGTLSAGVYNATSVDLNKTTFTVTGDPSQTFVLNVSGGFDVHQSEIVLEGGITASNVLFNVVGTGDVVTVGHSATVFLGDLLAVDRSIVVSELGVDSAPSAGPGNPGFLGRIIGGQCTDLIVHSGAEVTAPEQGGACTPSDGVCTDSDECCSGSCSEGVCR
jgi:hypothetical protein